ncbi:MAG: Crp/Fnr family transcriptional regulator [Dehalococcoidia bacterium]
MADSLRDALKMAPLLRDIPDGELGRLAARTTRLSCARRETIFSAGDPADSIYLLMRGTVRLYHLIEDGRELTIGIIMPWELFGLGGLLAQAPRQRFAQALTPVNCLRIPIDAVIALFGPHSARVLSFTSHFGTLVDNSEKLATSLAFRDVRGRLAQALLNLDERERGNDGHGQLRLTHADLATMIGTTREHVTRLLADFEADGYIAKQRGHLAAILDPEGLRAEIEATRETSVPLIGGSRGSRE